MSGLHVKSPVSVLRVNDRHCEVQVLLAFMLEDGVVQYSKVEYRVCVEAPGVEYNERVTITVKSSLISPGRWLSLAPFRVPPSKRLYYPPLGGTVI